MISAGSSFGLEYEHRGEGPMGPNGIMGDHPTWKTPTVYERLILPSRTPLAGCL